MSSTAAPFDLAAFTTAVRELVREADLARLVAAWGPGPVVPPQRGSQE